MKIRNKRFRKFKNHLKKFLTFTQLRSQVHKTREYRRWENGWKRNARFKGNALTSSMIRRVGSRERAIQLGLIKA